MNHSLLIGLALAIVLLLLAGYAALLKCQLHRMQRKLAATRHQNDPEPPDHQDSKISMTHHEYRP